LISSDITQNLRQLVGRDFGAGELKRRSDGQGAGAGQDALVQGPCGQQG
jgi:hypothetical protein